MIDKIFLEELKINDIGKLNFPDYADEFPIISGVLIPLNIENFL